MLRLNNFYKKSMFALMGCAILTTVACSNDDKEQVNDSISEAEAVDIIESAVVSESNGVAKMATDASVMAEEQQVYSLSPLVVCGEDYYENYASANTGVYSYDYAGNTYYKLLCTQAGSPATFIINHELTGTYDTPRMYSDDSVASKLQVTGLAPTQVMAVLNGSYVREGYQESKVHNMNHFNSEISITLNNLSVNKYTQVITGGTAAVIFNGVGSAGGNYNYTGSITFNGNGTATLIINGNTYTINL